MKFSLPGLPDSVQTTIINLLPGYFLLHFSTLTSVGLYSVADKIAKTIDMFKTSFNRAWSPFAFAHAGKEDEKYLYEKIFKLFAGGLFTLAFVLTVFSHEFISILTPPKYHAAAGLVGSICLYYALRALTLVFGTGLYSANRVAHTSYMTSIQLVVFVVGALLLVPSYGANGLILSLNVAVIAYFASYAMTVKKYFAFQFSSCRLLLLLLLALIGVGYVYQASQTVTGIVVVVNIIKKIVVVSLYILLGYFIILTRIERRSVKSGAKKLLAFCGLPLYAHNMNIEINDKDI